MKEVLYEVRCLKSTEDISNPVESPEFFRFMRQLLKLSSKCENHIFKTNKACQQDGTIVSNQFLVFVAVVSFLTLFLYNLFFMLALLRMCIRLRMAPQLYY